MRKGSGCGGVGGRMNDHLQKAKRIVVKVGSALLVDSAAGALKRDFQSTK